MPLYAILIFLSLTMPGHTEKRFYVSTFQRQRLYVSIMKLSECTTSLTVVFTQGTLVLPTRTSTRRRYPCKMLLAKIKQKQSRVQIV